MEWFDHTDITREKAISHGRQRLIQIETYDLSVLPGVVMHPVFKNITYFMIEYARALQLDMVKYPDKYGNVSFDYIYERMATAIANNTAIVHKSKPLQHACRAAGIPPNKYWIQTYIWYDQPVKTKEKTRFVSGLRRSKRQGNIIVPVKELGQHRGKLAKAKARYNESYHRLFK
jgi:hypothetical protein